MADGYSEVQPLEVRYRLSLPSKYKSGGYTQKGTLLPFQHVPTRVISPQNITCKL